MRVSLRAQGSNGGTKDWMCAAYPTGLTIWFGKTNSKLQKRVINVEKCAGRSPYKEAHRRLNKKLREGYSIIDDSRMHEDTDAPHHMLIIKRANCSDSTLVKGLNIVRKFINDYCPGLVEPTDKFIDIYINPKGEPALGMPPVEDWDKAQVLLAMLHLTPNIITVTDFNDDDMNAMALYKKHDMADNTPAHRVAITLGLLGKPEIFQNTQQTTQEWFY